MAIKTFDFPTFEEQKKTYNYYQKIGDYTCSISILKFGVKDVWQEAVAITNYPINNMINEKLDNIPDEKTLKQWYQAVIVKLNQEWKRFILETYLVGNIE